MCNLFKTVLVFIKTFPTINYSVLKSLNVNRKMIKLEVVKTVLYFYFKNSKKLIYFRVQNITFTSL